MQLRTAFLDKERLLQNFIFFLLALMLMAGILVVYWFPPLYSVFPVPIYLTLHMIIEFVGVVVSTAVFIVAWYNFQHTRSLQELIICLTFLTVGIISFAHTLSYNGMPDFFTPNSVNKASTYWISTRMARAVGLMAAVFSKPVVLKRKIYAFGYLFITVAVVSLLLVVILWDPGVLPRMYETGVGQTPVKVFLEYVGIFMEAVSLLYLVIRKRKRADELLIEAAILFLIFSSVAFTLYSSAYDTYNLIGHVYMVIGFMLILRGMFVSSLDRLYEANRVLAEQKQKLAEINTRLEELNRLKTQFLANTNHELRTPLTSIIAFTEMLLDKETGPLNDLQKDYLLEINDSSQQLLMDINNLLDFSKLEAGQTRLHIENCSVDEVVSQVLRQLKPIFRQKNQEVNVHLADPLPKMPVDREKLKKILINLLANAHKFSPAGGTIAVRVSLTKDGSALKVSIKDNGIGIDKSQAENIFEKFYQVDESLTRKYDGTGLGLAIVKEFVQLHGGRVWVTSEPEKGSTFTFTLPLKLADKEVV